MKKLNPVGLAAAMLAAPAAAAELKAQRAAREAELEAAARIAAERMPIKDAMKQIGEQLAADLDANLQDAVQRCLGVPMTDPEVVRGRLHCYPDHPDKPAEERGETFVLDGIAILWAGPVRLEREGDTMKGVRSLRHLLPEPGPIIAP